MTRHLAAKCTPTELLFGQRRRTAMDVIKPNLARKMEHNGSNMVYNKQNRK